MDENTETHVVYAQRRFSQAAERAALETVAELNVGQTGGEVPRNSVTIFYNELKRRRVFRAGVAYAVLAWLIAQIADVLCHGFLAPGWVIKAVLISLAIGLPIVLTISWYVDITTDGISWESDLQSFNPIAGQRDRIMDYAIIALLTLIIGVLVVRQGMHECFVMSGIDVAEVSEVVGSPNLALADSHLH